MQQEVTKFFRKVEIPQSLKAGQCTLKQTFLELNIKLLIIIEMDNFKFDFKFLQDLDIPFILFDKYFLELDDGELIFGDFGFSSFFEPFQVDGFKGSDVDEDISEGPEDVGDDLEIGYFGQKEEGFEMLDVILGFFDEFVVELFDRL